MMVVALLASALAADLGGRFSADPWAPAMDGGLIGTDTSALPEGYEARLLTTLAYHPLMAYTATGVEPVVGAALTVHASAVWRLGPARLGLRLPGVALLSADGLDHPRATAGDPELQLKLRPWSSERAGVAVLLGGTAPLDGSAWWAGADGPTASAGLALDVHPGPWIAALDLGAELRPSTILTLSGDGEAPTLGGQWRARLGVGRQFQWSFISIEAAAATGVADPGEAVNTPLEVLAQLERRRPDGRSWRVGGGIGVLPGVGAPALRLLVGVGQRPAPEAP